MTIEDGKIEGVMGCELDEANIEAVFYLEGDVVSMQGEGVMDLNDGTRTDESDWEGKEDGGIIYGEAYGQMRAYGDEMDYSIFFELER